MHVVESWTNVCGSVYWILDVQYSTVTYGYSRQSNLSLATRALRTILIFNIYMAEHHYEPQFLLKVLTIHFFLFNVRCFSANSIIFSSTGSPFLLRTLSMSTRVGFARLALSPNSSNSSTVVGRQNGSKSINCQWEKTRSGVVALPEVRLSSSY